MKLKMGRLGLMLVAAGLLTIGGGAAAVYAQSTTTVVMNEFTFVPDRMVVPAGRDTFTMQNTGQFPHNVHIEGNGVSVDVKPDGPVAGGESFSGTVTLAPGTYDVWCPVPTHRERGMVGTLTVASAAAGGAAQVPTALPRTGDSDATLAGAQAAVAGGLLLVVAGWFVRRRGLMGR
ncbi:MAG TPA: plastocyanin/azurin family copper-binding protein [Chloroflexota bacterium]|nr:plastocyanin/azurin family copper-binding protein [Chloroflexota bacterium]